MVLYLDSALVDEAKTAVSWGWVKGITTNPTLLAKSPFAAAETLKQLAVLSPGELYYQLTATDLTGMLREGLKAYEIMGAKTVLKVPATAVGFQAVTRLATKIPCAVTAIYSGAQAAVAREAGAKYAIAYVSRATRLIGDGIALIYEMSEILKGSQTKILAASIKSPEEASGSLQAGAHHLTLPLTMLQSLTTHELSEQTFVEFNKSGRGLEY